MSLDAKQNESFHVKSSRQVARPFLKMLYIVNLFLHIFMRQKKNNPVGSPGTAVFIMRKNAFLAEMEVCDIFYISIIIETRDSNEEPVCSS
jgi:hypothetical protein